MTQYTEYIKEWVKIDNQIFQLNKELKQLREKRENIVENIFNHNNEKKTIIISDGKLRVGYFRQTQPLSLKLIESALTDIIRDEDSRQEIMDHIKNKRNHKIEQGIKRYYN